ncbi:MAG TPA: PDR/VanB family oxidoreductase [Ramlibacter sp.]|uniref:PDR/VanB family oxidoreductase n=1 Tax=Ramlibacter sp. TaxID=1917967 RepID=UPI002C2ED828|nr:PDR/VanB family oxidoreductase [Ramlibacter sp.]HVZ45603.1 PDR/VanB family oxidoreductase [Ramlibacter sp.]
MNAPEMSGGEWLDAEVRDATPVGEGTLLLKLCAASGTLPSYEPGAHVAVRCGDAVRHYSLCGRGDAAAQYLLGVKLAPDSRGGSRWLFDNARPGTTLRISAPRNHFPLDEGRPAYFFLSGGIGLTPILAMLLHLRERGVRARLVHMCRARAELAFADWLEDLASFHDVHVHCDAEAGAIYDVRAALADAPADAAVYCCGPAALMNAVKEAGERLGRIDRYRFEFFSAPPQEPEPREPAQPAEFVVVQASTGRGIPVPADKTMLQALRDAGLEMKSECEYGVCGWCAVGVLDGEPKHFDSYLTGAERASNKLVLPCVSRCASASLTLDI